MPVLEPLEPLVETSWLAARLRAPQLRIFDCTVFLHRAATGTHTPYEIESGCANYRKGHIPGADFLDLHGELSDRRTKLPFMLPEPEQFVAAMSRHGIGAGTQVVLYSAANPMWATRVWWMLRAFGFDNGAVLDGGWSKWCREGRPVSTAPPSYPRATFVPRWRPGLFVGREEVLRAMEDEKILCINALNEYFYRGEGPSRYGRPGRIPGSVNLHGKELLDPETWTFISSGKAKAKFGRCRCARCGADNCLLRRRYLRNRQSVRHASTWLR